MARSHTSSPAGPRSVRGLVVWTSASGQGSPHSDPVFKDSGQKAGVPPAARGPCSPGGISPQSVPWLIPTARSVFLLGLGEGVPAEPAVTSGLPAPSSGSLKSRAHPGVTLRHRAPPGASTALRCTDSAPADASPCCHRPAAQAGGASPRLSITPSFSSSKTCLLKPPLGSLIFAWLYISGDIWTEIARKRL